MLASARIITGRFVLLCLIWGVGFGHPFYVSICQVDFNPKTKSLEVTFKINTADLESALASQGLHLEPGQSVKKSGDIIFRYLLDTVSFEIDTQEVQFVFVGHEVERDLTYCYVEIPKIDSMNTLTVTDTILFESFEEQTNIVNINYKGQKRSMRLLRNKAKDTAEFRPGQEP